MNTEIDTEEFSFEECMVNSIHNQKMTADCRDVQKALRKIFPPSKAKTLSRAVEFVRIDSWIDNAYLPTSQKTEANQKAEAFMERLDMTTVSLSQQFYKGRAHAVLSDHDRQNLQWLELELYKYYKAYNKRTRYIPYSLLTPGTVVERTINGVDYGEKKIFTVASISDASLGTVIITTKEKVMQRYGNPTPFPTSVEHSFNSSHVLRIIKHVPGRLAIRTYRKDRDDLFMAHPGKSKNVYRVQSLSYLILTLSRRLQEGKTPDFNSMVDMEKLTAMVAKGLGKSIKRTYYPDSDWVHYVEVKKDKVNDLVRRLYNKALVTMKCQTELEEEYHRQEMGRFDEDFDN